MKHWLLIAITAPGLLGETLQDTLNYFPMSVGQRWHYASTYDSTFITVVDSHEIGEDSYFEFDAWYPYEAINAFHFEGYEVMVNSGAADQLLYDFGADLNDSWMFNFPGTDISEITLTSRGDTLATPYGTFTNCMGFHRYIGSDYEYYDWFAPDIGLIQRDVVTFAGPHRYQLYDMEQVVVGIDETEQKAPHHFILNQNYPNPFNPSTQIPYAVPAQMEISVVIYDVTGTQINELQKGIHEAGNYTLQWLAVNDAGTPVPAGLYFCRVTGLGLAQSIKMVHLK